MKIYEFKGKDLLHWTPKSIERGGNTHHNLRIGDYNKLGWEYMFGIDDSIVDLTKPPVPMEGEYFLVPIQSKDKDTEFLKDKKGNSLYYIKELVGHCDEPCCLLGLTLTSRSVLDFNILDDTGILSLAVCKQEFKTFKEIDIYLLHPNQTLTFEVITRLETIKYSITMKNNKLVLSTQP